MAVHNTSLRRALVQLEMPTQFWSSSCPQTVQLYLKCVMVLLWWTFQSSILARYWILISFSLQVICWSLALQVAQTWFVSTCSLEVTEPITCKCSCHQHYTISMALRMGSSEVTVYFFITLFPNHLQIQCVTNSYTEIIRTGDIILYKYDLYPKWDLVLWNVKT